MRLGLFIISVLTSLILNAAEKAPLEPPYTSSDLVSTEAKPIPKPDDINDEGDYFYGEDYAKDAVYYKMGDVPSGDRAFYVRFGTVGPYDLSGDSGKTFKQIYSDKESFVVGFDYEKRIGNLLGNWSYKLSSGITTEEGVGTFATIAGTPEEKFLFIIFPNTVSANYKLRFSDKQWFTPYFDAGAGYFTFIEYRNDGKKTIFGGSPVLVGAAGLLISISAFDKRSSQVMYEDYKVTDLWLDIQFRRIEGLNKKKDFSSNMLTAGFGFVF